MALCATFFAVDTGGLRDIAEEGGTALEGAASVGAASVETTSVGVIYFDRESEEVAPLGPTEWEKQHQATSPWEPIDYES